MRSKSHSAESEDTGIDLAPMLDFVLNLLIFFIITTSFVKEAGHHRDQARGADRRAQGERQHSHRDPPERRHLDGQAPGRYHARFAAPSSACTSSVPTTPSC